MKLVRGDFKEYGARVTSSKSIVFTVKKAPVTKDFSILIFEIDSKKLLHKIELTDEYAFGLVYSVEVFGLDFSKLCYLLQEDGTEYIDPYATQVIGRDTYKDADGRKNDSYSTYAGISRIDEFYKDTKVDIKPMDMLMYKIHMRGFTFGNKLAESKAGNYKGIISKIPYLKKLGVTSLELMPIYDFEELFLEKVQNISKKGELTYDTVASGKVNYWGYGNANYFAPKASYFGGARECCLNFQKMISKLHENQIEVILELSFSSEVGTDYIIDCLKYYVRYFHVDGFHLIGLNVPVARIAQEPYLANTKIFVEYISDDILLNECGRKHLFIYNDSFMYVTRQIQNHMNGSMVQFANHMRRQNDVYGFVNYTSSVCGFSLWDSFSYGEKHNLDNGENNRDGNNSNYSFNYGVEGKTNNKYVNANRFLQMRNSFAALLLSQAIPLIVAGDELAATHEGNNNPYCQDNAIGYTVFSKTKNKNILSNFVEGLVAFRKQHKCIHPENAFCMNDSLHIGLPDMSFHGNEPWMMNVGEEQKALGVLYSGAYADENEEVYVCYNFHYDEMEMALPLLANKKRWRLICNTADFDDKSTFEPKIINNQQSIKVPGSSVSVLIGMKV